MDIKAMLEQVEQYRDEAVKMRRDLHKHAENGWLEFRTTAKVAEFLEGCGIPFVMGKQAINPEYVMEEPSPEKKAAAIARAERQGARKDLLERTEGYTGVIATIDSGKPGPTVGLRFDMDCNDLEEPQNDPTHRPCAEGFASINPGCQHSCGHDAHVTIGLLTCRILNEHKSELRGKVKIFFQPAEEGVRGALAMARTGQLEDIDYFLAGHVGFGAKTIDTFIASCTGLLATSKINAYFHGEPAHAGAAPEAGANALLAASAASLMMHAQCQDGRGAARVNVGVMKAGSGRNVVPAEAEIQVETRGLTNEINEDMRARAERCIRAGAEAYGCTVDMVPVGGAASADSDPELAAFAADTVREYGLARDIKSDFYFGASEDASFLMQAVQKHGGQAIYMMYGTEIKAPHHNNHFDINEEVLMTAPRMVLAITSKLLLTK